MLSNSLSAAGATNRSLSRIEADVESVKRMTSSVELLTERVMRHARSLGYFGAPDDPKESGPTPVITTLADALSALDRAITTAGGSLNVFD